MKLRNKKTGEIKTVRFPHYEWGDDDKQYTLNIFDYEGNEYNYNTLAELKADWEDYKPKEPLIKDEKIRKAVRAWAEVNDIIAVAHYTFDDELTDFRAWDKFGKECDIMFYRQVGLDESRHYTITELCGEDEE